ncbi:hypothetical protein SAMN05661091_4421 [Paenibacillus uliginis N3/975]|uniref:Uncharacterized protein n=1 Tax=Paenibacillus uliginis N3/975 TaxID=1313296 RepID=A0A1X7HLB3_9BACL|nr:MULTISPECIES: hypothetical protein [Paenibacillus]UNK19964.1 hypothetical protein MNQ98_08085 [Paenibacillus sp. N3/727]SMF88820.1 hypothetical protein SAMN05661091_4421 [Paenibacillus uliginis N3/975]
MNLTKDLAKLIRLTGDRAKLDAKANGTYIVYKTNEGQIVREYSTGKIEKMNEQDFTHE